MKTKHAFSLRRVVRGVLPGWFNRAIKREFSENAGWPTIAVPSTFLLLFLFAIIKYLGPLHLDRSSAEALVMVGLTLIALACLPWES